MADQSLDLVGLVRTLVEPIVEYKDDLEIIESEQGEGSLLIEVRVNDEDTGKVIGRQGRVIKAIRTIARAAASRAGEHVDVELLD
ncbi:MAG: KH domain-containing protein [Eggerthellaceae bacterium]|nr:KH domain-containing protein [Eggerthellaceae bacterium]